VAFTVSLSASLSEQVLARTMPSGPVFSFGWLRRAEVSNVDGSTVGECRVSVTQQAVESCPRFRCGFSHWSRSSPMSMELNSCRSQMCP
jgi:hypothetical protein